MNEALLFNKVKNYLNITWDDDNTDEKLRDTILRANGVICRYCSVDSVNYFSDMSAYQLFLDCCRYIWADSFEEFEHNFLSQINSLQLDYEVMRLAET